MPDETEVWHSPHALYSCRGSSMSVTRSATPPSPELAALASTAPTKIFRGSGPGRRADEKRCMLHAMPTLQQRGLQRPMDLAGRTAETAARSPKFLPCGCHSDPRVALDVVSGCHCELTHHAPRLIATEGEVGDEKAPKLRYGYRCRYGRIVNV